MLAEICVFNQVMKVYGAHDLAYLYSWDLFEIYNTCGLKRKIKIMYIGTYSYFVLLISVYWNGNDSRQTF